MKKFDISTVILVLGAVLPILGGLLHILIIFGGYYWHQYFHAPQFILESVSAGTWLAPIAGIIVASLFILSGLYALSAAGLVRRLPFLKLGLLVIGILFTVRGLLLFHLIYWKPEVIDAFRVISGLIFLFSGLAFLVGTYFRWSKI